MYLNPLHLRCSYQLVYSQCKVSYFNIKKMTHRIQSMILLKRYTRPTSCTCIVSFLCIFKLNIRCDVVSMRIDSNIFLCYNLNCRAKAVSCLRNIFFLPSVKCLVTSEKKNHLWHLIDGHDTSHWKQPQEIVRMESHIDIYELFVKRQFLVFFHWTPQ